MRIVKAYVEKGRPKKTKIRARISFSYSENTKTIETYASTRLNNDKPQSFLFLKTIGPEVHLSCYAQIKQCLYQYPDFEVKATLFIIVPKGDSFRRTLDQLVFENKWALLNKRYNKRYKMCRVKSGYLALIVFGNKNGYCTCS